MKTKETSLNSWFWLLFIHFFVTLHIDSSAQTRFHRTYGGAGDDVAINVFQATDGGYLLSGYTSSFGSGMKDAYIIKTDAFGTEQWSRTIGGSLDDEASYAVEDSGQFIIGGYTNNYGAGGRDAFLTRLDSAGSIVWYKTYGTTGNDNATFRFNKTMDDGYIIAYAYNYFDFQYTLIKTDKSGTKQWSRAYGGLNTDVGGAVVQCADSGYLVNGYTYNYGLGLHDFLITRTDKSGNILWDKTIGGSHDEGGGYYLKMITANHAFITGQVNNFMFGPCDILYISLNSETGGVVMANEYGKAGKSLRPLTGTTTPDHGFASDIYDFTPSVKHDMGILKTDSSGKISWVRRYGDTGDDVSFAIWNTRDSGFALAGFTTSFGAGGKDVYFVKTDANGHAEIGTSCYEREDTLQESLYVYGETTPALPETSPFDFNNNYTVSPLVPTDSSTKELCSIPPFAGFQASDTILCANDCIDFIDQSINASSWQWYFAGAIPSSSTVQNPTSICYLSEGDYNVTLIVSNGSANDTLTFSNYIGVNPAPPTPNIIQSVDTLKCTTNPLYITYQWYADSALVPNATNSYYIIHQSGNYNVKVTNAEGCSISVGINIVIAKLRDYQYPRTEILLLTNPVFNELIISGLQINGETEINLYNILGEKVLSQKNSLADNQKSLAVDVSFINSGIYFVHVVNAKRKWAGMFVKQ